MSSLKKPVVSRPDSYGEARGAGHLAWSKKPISPLAATF
jgi:hypothetical protein